MKKINKIIFTILTVATLSILLQQNSFAVPNRPAQLTVYSQNGQIIVTLADNGGETLTGSFGYYGRYSDWQGEHVGRLTHIHKNLGVISMAVYVNNVYIGQQGIGPWRGDELNNSLLSLVPNGASVAGNYIGQIGQTFSVRVDLQYRTDGSSPPSTTIYRSVTVLPPLPGTPVINSSGYVPGSQLYTARLNLNWTASSYANGYRLYRNGSLVADLGLVTSYTIDNQNDNTTYQYVVEAYNAAGNTSSAPANIVVPDLHIDPPLDLEISPQPNGFNQQNGVFNLSWIDVDTFNNQAGYHIYINSILSATLVSHSTTWTSPQLAENTTHVFTVRSFNGSNIESPDLTRSGVISPGVLYQRLTFYPMKVTGNTGSTLNFAVTVYDSVGQVVQDAPVTFSILSGTGTFESYIPNTIVSTNAQGVATVNVVLGSSDFVLHAGVLNQSFGYAHGSHENVPFSVYSVNSNTVSTVNYDNNYATVTGSMNNLNTDILHVYGVSLNPITSTSIDILPSEDAYIAFVATNVGNAADIISIATANLPVSWDIQIVSGLTTASATPLSSINLPQNSTVNFWIRVSPPDTELNVSFSVNILFNVTTTYDDNGAYAGLDANSPVFAGPDLIAGTAPVRTFDTNAPTISYRNVMPDAINVRLEVTLYFQVLDRNSGININSLSIITSTGIPANISYSDIGNDLKEFRVTFDPTINFDPNIPVSVTLSVADNWNGLGGPNQLVATYNFYTIAGPLLVVSRSIENVIKPPTALGNANDLIPGSKLFYHAEIGNEGISQATSINIRVDMPAHTKFYGTGTGDEQELDFVVGGNTYDTFALSGGISANVQAVIFKIDTIDINTTKNIRYEVTVD